MLGVNKIMTQVTAKMVQELRERTGVGMMECKKALVAANGEIDVAIESLRKAGQATAVKKGGRVAAEGLVAGLSSADNQKVELVEVNCETDFVARENTFKQFCKQVTECALQHDSDNVDNLMQATIGGNTVEATRLEIVAQLGENIVLRRAVCVKAPAGGVVALYLHGGDAATARIATAVALDVNDLSLARDIAMHIAGMKQTCRVRVWKKKRKYC
jgi:elongation factor Ts